MLRVASPLLILVLAAPALAQDRVTFRDRSSKGPQTTSGKIDSESLAGVKISGRTIPAADIIEINYDVPAIKLDYPRAMAAEARSAAEATPLYEAMLRVPNAQNNKGLKALLEYKIAMLAAARAEESADQRQKAIAALNKFKADHADAWELVPLTRTLARLHLDREPPDYDAARKAWDDLAAAAGAPAEVKLESALQAIDLLLVAGKNGEAKQKAAALPAGDPRSKVYQVGCEGGQTAVKQLEEMIDKTSDRNVKAAAYNMLGDVYRRDPKTKKEALYAYLWVDVIYNDDPTELAKADDRLANLFAELKDPDRARKYRDKVRGK
jgi:hypothetical protein